MTTDPQAAAIVVAAGRGVRMGASVAKAFLPVLGQPMVLRTVLAVERARTVRDVVVVVGEQDVGRAQEVLSAGGCRKVSAVVAGGPERQDSVLSGLQRAAGAEVVAVHDGARPLVSPAIVDSVVRAAYEVGAASAGIPMRETVKHVDGGEATSTADRGRLWIARTPQAFHTALLKDAHQRARAEGVRVSDDAALVERLGRRVRMVEDSPANLKITLPEDLAMAEALLTFRNGSVHRAGVGVDAHRFVPGRRLVIGGVEIPSPLGLAGHSDADVLTHAVMDAVLGAAGLGDIGRHFSPDDPAYKDADSLTLLRQVASMVAAAGWRMANVDAMVLAEAPRLAPFIEEMRRRLADGLGIDASCVSVKATTMEGLGPVGRGEGIVAHAVAMLTSVNREPGTGS